MATNHIELSIGSKFDNEGMQKLDGALKKSAAGFGRTAGSVSRVMESLSGLDSSVGKAAGKVSSLAAQFMQGGVFGVAMGLASMAIAKITEHFTAMKKAAADAAEYLRTQFSAALGDVDAKTQQMVAGFQKANAKISKQLGRDNAHATGSERAANTVNALKAMLGNNEQATGAAKSGLAEAQKKLAEAEESAAKYIIERQRAQDRIAAIEEHSFADAGYKIRELNKARAAAKKVEEDYAADAKQLQEARDAVKKAEDRLASVVEVEEEARLDLAAAEHTLSLEREKEAKTVADAKQKQSDDLDALMDDIIKDLDEQEAAEREAAEAERERTKNREEAEKKRIEAEKKRDEAKANADKKIAELDAKIAAAKEEAARLEENAARARGKSVGEWKRGERELAREQQKEAHKQQMREKQVDQEIARLRKFSPRALTKGQRERLADLMQWKENQNPANNPALKQVEILEKEKLDLIAKTQRDISDIALAVKDGVAA